MGIDSQEKEKFLEENETKYLQISAKKFGEKSLLAAKPDKTLNMNHFISFCNEEDANDYLIITGYIAETVGHIFESKRESLKIAMN